MQSFQAETFIKDLKSRDPQERHAALEKLSKESRDPTLAKHFVDRKGVQFLADLIDKSKRSAIEPVLLAFALGAYSHIMNHKFLSWDDVADSFATTVRLTAVELS